MTEQLGFESVAPPRWSPSEVVLRRQSLHDSTQRLLGALISCGRLVAPGYRIRNFGRFATHLAWVTEHGTDALIERALASNVGFAKDSTLGPWGGAFRVDAGLVDSVKACDDAAYLRFVQASYREMFDCDSAPGPCPERLMEIKAPVGIVPG